MTAVSYVYPAPIGASFAESAVDGFIGQTPLLWFGDDCVRATVTEASPIWSNGRIVAAEIRMETDTDVHLIDGPLSIIHGTVEIDTLP